MNIPRHFKMTCLGMVFPCLFAGGIAKAALIVTSAEDPNSYTSTLSGVSTLDFNNFTAGTTTYNYSWATVGTIDQVHVINGNQYGGAGSVASIYPVQSTSGSLGAIATTTLNLSHSIAYFGLWWSAGDAGNRLIFKSGSTVVAQFTSGDILNMLSSAYNGNPRNRTLDSSEKFAFLNFYGEAGTTWDSITFTNTGGSGFESDNWTVRTEAWGDKPGETGGTPGTELLSIQGTAVTAVPEPTVSILAVFACAALVVRRRRE